MLSALDNALLDRVFQPIADRLVERTSCFELARSLLFGVLVLVLAIVCADYLEGRLRGWEILWTPSLFYIAWVNLYFVRDAENGAKRRSGTMNGLRNRMAWQRLYWLVMLALSLYWFALGPRTCSSFLSVWLDLCLVGATYFMACEKTEPPPHRARAWAGFALVGAR